MLELQPGTVTVQRGALTIASGTTASDTLAAAVDPARSAVSWLGYQAPTCSWDGVAPALTLADSMHVAASKYAASACASTVGYEVISFP